MFCKGAGCRLLLSWCSICSSLIQAVIAPTRRRPTRAFPTFLGRDQYISYIDSSSVSCPMTFRIAVIPRAHNGFDGAAPSVRTHAHGDILRRGYRRVGAYSGSASSVDRQTGNGFHVLWSSGSTLGSGHDRSEDHQTHLGESWSEMGGLAWIPARPSDKPLSAPRLRQEELGDNSSPPPRQG